VSQAEINVAQVVSTPFEENSFIVYRAGASSCVVIDPGLEPEEIIAFLEKNKLTPNAILLTHGHGDHIGGIPAMKERFPECRVLIGEADAEKLTDPVQNLSEGFGIGLTVPRADQTLSDGETLEVAGLVFEVHSVPGHSAGHVVYLVKELAPPIVFVGDVIFRGGIGRTDFPDSNHAALLSGIRSKLYVLPDDTVLVPGHGPTTTVGQEKQTNPFVREN